MFDKIKNFVNNYIRNSNSAIIIESETIYLDKKLKYSFSNEGYMASLAILSDFTYDFFVIEIESEKMLMVNNMQFDNGEELLKQLKNDFKNISK